MRPQIAVFGGSFNPPGLHHRQVVNELVSQFDRVIIVPCGPRPDKLTPNDVEPVYRAALADLAFQNIAKSEVDLFDLEQASFTLTDELDKRYSALGDIWHVVGSHLTKGGATGNSIIQKRWAHGKEMWNNLRFAVVVAKNDQETKADLPPQSKVITLKSPNDCTSQLIRDKIFNYEPYEHLITPEIQSYIERYSLYRAQIPSRSTRWTLDHSKVLLFSDPRDQKARPWIDKLKEFNHPKNPACIIVIGGDGTMIRAIRQHWRLRVPFFGINSGHLGFLLNDASVLPENLLPLGETFVRQLPMLYVSLTKPDGTHQETLAFNDAWIERATSQSAWMQVSVNGRVRLENVISDGVLVCTAAGSTAYARSMGVSPLLADTAAWLIVGSNVMSPANWKSALLPRDAFVEVVSTGGEKRPLEAFVDGISMGKVTSMRARMSRIATVELSFCSLRDLAEKIAEIQFPKTSV